MAAATQLIGDEFVMVDGTTLVTEVLIDSQRAELCLSFMYRAMVEHQDMVVGHRMKEDVEKLRLLCPLGFKNVVDLGELVSDVVRQPRLRAVGVRTLAFEVFSLPFKTRSLSDTIVSWYHPLDVQRNQIECVTFDAYAAYKIGKKFLGI
ncbi:hypothetical protein V6N11_014379 [Hibiscus sabdariffa]|uniref:Uncharacterized protein n=2 Tax=Hibiscus sabdariffa TaxID=183260 RepID=A0ABR2B3I7_9ROSI